MCFENTLKEEESFTTKQRNLNEDEKLCIGVFNYSYFVNQSITESFLVVHWFENVHRVCYKYFVDEK